MKIFRLLLCLSFFLSVPYTGNCQIGKAIKQASKIFVKKGTKESVEAAEKAAVKKAGKEAASVVAGRAAKNSSELLAKKVFLRNASKSIVSEPANQLIKTEAKELKRIGAERFLRSRIDKSIANLAGRTVRTEGKSIGIHTIKNSGEKVARELGSKESKEIFESGTKQEMKKSSRKILAKRAVKATGEDALKLLKDLPDVTTLLKSMQKQYGPLFDIKNLEVVAKDGKYLVSFKGTNSTMEIAGDVIRANGGSYTRTLSDGTRQNIGEINQFLNNILPSKTYIVEDGLIKYTTNAAGKVCRIECESSKLYARMMANNMYRNGEFDKNMVAKVMRENGVTNSSHDFGHLVRREIGGLNEGINGLPMKGSNQRSGSKWFKFEEKEVKACKEGKSVRSIMEINHAPDGSYTVEVTKIIDGKEYTQIFNDLY